MCRSAGADFNCSERESEIIRLVALGLTNAQVARRLHISHHTVGQHIAQMLRRCRARSRCELVARAYAGGALWSWPPQRAGLTADRADFAAQRGDLEHQAIPVRCL